jgi:hypothetical protein
MPLLLLVAGGPARSLSSRPCPCQVVRLEWARTWLRFGDAPPSCPSSIATFVAACSQVPGPRRAIRRAANACNIKSRIGSHLRLIRRRQRDPDGDRPRALVRCEPLWR